MYTQERGLIFLEHFLTYEQSFYLSANIYKFHTYIANKFKVYNHIDHRYTCTIIVIYNKFLVYRSFMF